MFSSSLSKHSASADSGNASAPVISMRDVNFAFGQGPARKQILFNVEFELSPGEIVILEGPSGSGKTTLLTLISGLRRLVEGTIRVFGMELNGAGNADLIQLRRQIGFIFQLHNLLPFLTALRNVELVFELLPEVTPGEARSRAAKILELMGMAPWQNAYPANLSVGQKQRIAIGRALVAEPRLILADEPTASLDSQSGRQVVDILQKLARSHGIPILLVTHDSRILDIADRKAHMEDGRILP